MSSSSSSSTSSTTSISRFIEILDEDTTFSPPRTTSEFDVRLEDILAEDERKRISRSSTQSTSSITSPISLKPESEREREAGKKKGHRHSKSSISRLRLGRLYPLSGR